MTTRFIITLTDRGFKKTIGTLRIFHHQEVTYASHDYCLHTVLSMPYRLVRYRIDSNLTITDNRNKEEEKKFEIFRFRVLWQRLFEVAGFSHLQEYNLQRN
jgi:hypothetical protein